MTSADISYFRARAEQERDAARQASKAYVAEIHLELARAYDALADHPELRSRVRVVSG